MKTKESMIDEKASK